MRIKNNEILSHLEIGKVARLLLVINLKLKKKTPTLMCELIYK